ncbi:MAG: glutamine synthetase [Methanobacteriaceae archaeon]|nr:glutamine synthetase [Methanobacteriaceae archaeon]
MIKNNKECFPSNINYLRILWCDNANMIRGKLVKITSDTDEIYTSISEAQQAVPVMYDRPIPEAGLTPVGEIYLKADLESFAPISYAPGQGQVMGDMFKNLEEWEYCPRGFLKRMISKLAREGLEIKASFENEFYLLKNKNNGLEPVDNTLFASTYSMDINYDVIEHIMDSLGRQDIIVEQYYPESGPGQQEITIKYASALEAADNQIAFRETVKSIAQKHGLIASFLPKIDLDRAGSGCHLHISLWNQDQNIIFDHKSKLKLSKTVQMFIAGILNHLPALMAITTPIPNSYHRIQPQSWSGAFQCWGFDNREAAIRVVTEKDHSIKHFEFKTLDAASNPYLALGAIIAAGLNGIENGLKLENPLETDPANLKQENGTDRIIPLPSSLNETIACLEKDKVIRKAMGANLSKAYIAVKKAEEEFFKNLKFEEEVKILLERY